MYPTGALAEAPNLEYVNTTKELGPGFGDPWNKYAWAMQDYGGNMYVATNNVNFDLQGILADPNIDLGNVDPANPFLIFPALADHTNSKGAEIWKYNYATEAWSQDYGDKVGEFSTGFRKMEVYDGKLFAATVSTSGAAELYSTNGDGEWNKVDMTGGPIAPSLRAMTVFDDGTGEKLYVGTETLGIPGFDAQIWSYDKVSGWQQVVSGLEAIQELEVHNGQLYAGTINHADGSLFKIDTSTGVATSVGPTLEPNAVGVAKLYDFGDTLYMGSANFINGFEFYSMKDGEWTTITTDGFGNENNTYTWSMVDYNDKLYMATFTAPDLDLVSDGVDSSIIDFLGLISKPELWVLDGEEWVTTELPGYLEGWGIWDYGIRNMEVGNDTLFLGTASNLFAPNGDEFMNMLLATLSPGMDFSTWTGQYSDLINRVIGPGTEIWAATEASSVPEPSATILYGTVIAGLAFLRSTRKKRD